MRHPPSCQLRDLDLGPELGDGGQGVVRALADRPGRPPMVCKRYTQPLTPDRVRHLEHLASLRGELALGMARFAWPEVLVRDGDQLAGVLMRRAPEAFSATFTLRSGATQRRLREVQYLLFGAEKLRRLGVPFASLSERLELLNGVVGAVGLLHHHDLVYGDLSARNVLYSTTGAIGVFLLDCDGLAVRGSAHLIDSPDWDDPAAPDVASPASDVYKLGLLAARVLAVHPTTRELPADGATPAAVAGVLRAALDPAPAGRPHIDDVATAFAGCSPGPGRDADDLPRWGLRRGTGAIAAVSVPAPPRHAGGLLARLRGSRP